MKEPPARDKNEKMKRENLGLKDTTGTKKSILADQENYFP